MDAAEPPGPPYDARSVANFILEYADAQLIRLTQLQLYKIIYFCHGWYLASNSAPLIRQRFEAWQYGPVLKVVRNSFERFGKGPITSKADMIDFRTGEIIQAGSELKAADALFVISVFDIYEKFDGWALSELTHEKGSPWDLVWNSDAPIGRLGLYIGNDVIESFFKSVPNRFLRN